MTSDDFSHIALNIVLRYSKNKIIDHLHPFQIALKSNDKRNMIIAKKKLIKWHHIVYELKKKDSSLLLKANNQSSSNHMPIPISALPSNYIPPTTITKTKSNQSNSSFRSTKLNRSANPLLSPYQCTYDSDLSQNTSKNTIIRIMNANRINNTNDYCSIIQSQFDKQFLQRQNTFLIAKERTKERLKRELEEGAKSECTFSPKINNKRKLKRNKSAFNRLYADNFERQNKLNMKQYELMELIKTEANNNNKTQYDPKRIDELYEEYKLKEKKQMELFEKINKEQGFPFVPCVNKPKKNKNRNLSFDETFNTRVQDKENLNYVLDYIKYKEGKDIN